MFLLNISVIYWLLDMHSAYNVKFKTFAFIHLDFQEFIGIGVDANLFPLFYFFSFFWVPF